jgi:hypothetical protein
MDEVETLRSISRVLVTRLGLNDPEEGDSSHYAYHTYFRWRLDPCSVTLYVSDDSRGHLEVSVESDDDDVTVTARRFEDVLRTLTDDLRTRAFKE